MIVPRKKPDDLTKRNVDLVQNAGNTDYVLNGTVYKNAPLKSVIVPDGSALNTLQGYEPGTIAYTAGIDAMWQLSPAGEWVSII